jgi:hypothetical protein
MLISTDVRIPFPLRAVFETYRDRLLDVAPYMSNVRSVELASRQHINDRLHCIYHWKGNSDIPRALRSFIGEDMLAWTEYNAWDPEDHLLVWQIETHAFTEAVQCSGYNHFLAEGDHTIIQSRGEMTIDAERIEGVPSFIAATIAKTVEGFLAKKIEPNLLDLGNGIRQYLEQTTGVREPSV